MTRLPCMAVKQPWADLLVRGIKDVENRNSAMPRNLVGQWCAVYASKTLAPVGSWIDAMDVWHSSSVQMWPWPATEIDEFDRSHPWPHHEVQCARKECARGAIVGLVRWQESYHPYDGPKSQWRDRSMHGWTYSDRIVLPEPVPLPDGGKQSLYWYLDEQVTGLVRAHAYQNGAHYGADGKRLWNAEVGL